jgi:hypothetical protein
VPIVRRIAGIVLAGAAVVALAWLSRVPYDPDESGSARLRLSWRARGEALARCRKATAQELEGIPAHMRQETVCEGARVAPYQLRVVIDGDTVLDERAAGSGVPGDRPLYVLREFDVVPGRHHVQVQFEKHSISGRPDDATAPSADAADDQASRRRAIPPRLDIDSTVTVPEHAVLLVTYDSERRQLVLRGADTEPD